MLSDQRYDVNSTDLASDNIFPAKKKTGVFQKTKQALEKVNSKLKNSSNKPASMGQMMLFESDGSLSFDIDDVDDNVVKPFSEMTLRIDEKDEDGEGEDASGTRSTEAESLSEHRHKDTKELETLGENDHLNNPSPRRHQSLLSSRKKHSSRNARGPRGRKSGNPPKKAQSCGDIQSSSTRPSSARLKRHTATSVSSRSPGALGSSCETPTRLSKESVAGRDLPGTPLTETTEYLQETPEPVDKTLKQESRALEEDTRATGGYFNKLVEKLEGDESQGGASKKVVEINESEDGKKASKFKTPKGIKKFFSLNRTPKATPSTPQEECASKKGVKESDMAMFTAFISSPKPLDSPRRSDSSSRKRSTSSTDDDDAEPEMDFPEIPSEKQTRLDDIRKEVCWKRESSSVVPSVGPESPGTLARKSRNDPVKDGAESPGTLARKARSDPAKDQGSPSSRRQRRIKSRDSDDRPKKTSAESIPRHSMSSRRHRTLRESESSCNDKEKNQDKPLSRSSHRSRRSRGSTSRTTLDTTTSSGDKATQDQDHDHNDANESSEKCVGASEEKSNTRPSEHRLSRSSRGSSRRLVSRSSSENGSSTQHTRRKRVSGSRKPDPPVSDPASPSSRPGRNEARGAQLRQLGRSTSLSQLYSKPERPREGRKFQSLCVESEHNTGNLFSVDELDSSETEELPHEDEVDTTGEVSCAHENEKPPADQANRIPSLAESLERGSHLNQKLFDHDGQETVHTDDGSCWLDQGSVTGLNIRSSASVVAPQLSFDQSMTKIVEHG